MRRDSLLLLGLLTTICLVAGLVLGIGSGRLAVSPPVASRTAPRPAQASPTIQSTTPAAAPNLQPTVSTRQMALLIIGVADKNAAQPKLEGCWIVAYNPGISHYYVIGFLPEAQFRVSDHDPEQPLADIYAQGVQQQLGNVFVRDAIQTDYRALTVQAVVTLDRSNLADLTTKVGGVTLDGQLLLGSSLAAAYDTQSFNGTAARIAFQRIAFEALFQALADQQWSPGSLAAYLLQLPGAVEPADAAALNDMVAGAPALQNSELTWTVAGGAHETGATP